MSESRLWTSQGRARWFLVPSGVELPPGPFPIRAGLSRQRVDEDALAPYEITPEQAEAHLGRGVSDLFRAVRERVVAVAPGLPLPESPEAIFGASPGAMMRDTAVARDGLRHAAASLVEAAGQTEIVDQVGARIDTLREDLSDADGPIASAARDLERGLGSALPPLADGLERLARSVSAAADAARARTPRAPPADVDD
jgi:hypothetical protein